MEKLQLQSPLRKIIDTINAVIENCNNDADVLKSLKATPEAYGESLDARTLNGKMLEIKTAGQYKITYDTEEGDVSVYLNDSKGVNGIRYDLNKEKKEVDLLLTVGDLLLFKTRNVKANEHVTVTLTKNLISYIYDHANDVSETRGLFQSLQKTLANVDGLSEKVTVIDAKYEKATEILDALNNLINDSDTVEKTIREALKKTGVENFVTDPELQKILKNYVTKADMGGLDLTEQLKAYATKQEVTESLKVITEEAIKTKLSDMTGDSEHRTVSDAEKAKWDNKVDKVDGKTLSTNDYNNVDKAKVNAIPPNPKYTDTIPDLSPYAKKAELKENLSDFKEDSGHRTVSDTEKTTWNNKVDKEEGKVLSSNDYTATDKAKVDAIPEDPKYTDTIPDLSPYAKKAELKTKLSDFEEDGTHRTVTDAEKIAWNKKVDAVTGKGLSSNDYTHADKLKVDAIPDNPKYTDTVQDLSPYAKKAEIKNGLSEMESDSEHRTVTDAEKKAWNNKVDAEEGKGLSSNDYTDADKEKLAALSKGSGYTGPPPELLDYVKKTELPNFSLYAKKADLPDLSPYAKKEELPDPSLYAKTTDLDIYAKKGDIKTKLSELTSDSMYRTVTDAEKETWNKKVDQVNGKSLSTNDYTDEDKLKVSAIPENPKYTDTIPDLSPYAKKSDLKNSLSEMADDQDHRTVSDTEKDTWNKKVDSEEGKALSSNDYTNEDKAKVTAIPTNPKYTDTVVDVVNNLTSGGTSKALSAEQGKVLHNSMKEVADKVIFQNTPSSDFNSSFSQGYYNGSFSSNTPEGSGKYTLVILPTDTSGNYSTTYQMQFAIKDNNKGNPYFRLRKGSTFTPWRTLSSNDYSDTAKAKVDAIPSNPKYTDTIPDLSPYATKQELSQIDVSDQLSKYALESEVGAIRNTLNNKVDKVSGKQLSTNDYTTSDRNKVNAIPSNPKYTDTITTVNGKTGAISKSDIVALGIPGSSVSYSNATTSSAGLMSAADKKKLDEVKVQVILKEAAYNALSSTQKNDPTKIYFIEA